MVSTELGPRIQFAPEDASENPYESVLARYEEIVGHRNPLPTSEATGIISRETGADLRVVLQIIDNLQGVLNLENPSIPPDVFMFEYDFRSEKGELEQRFGWKRITPTQTTHTLRALSGTSRVTMTQQIHTDIIASYPSIEPVLQEPTFPIPARFFLDRFDRLLTEEERAVTERVIKKYHLTPTEYVNLILISCAQSNQEIAVFIGASPGTVKNHLYNLMSKLSTYGDTQIYDRTQAAIVARQEGLFPPSLAMTLPEIGLIPNLQRLSPREWEILQNVAQGMSNRETADKLEISYLTVKNHLTSIYDKLDCSSNRTAAALIYHLNTLQSQTQKS